MVKISFPKMTPVMPYGEYKGCTMREIPSGYLHWIIENWEGDDIRNFATEEYERREDENDHWG